MIAALVWSRLALGQDAPPADDVDVVVIENERRRGVPPFRFGLRAALRSDLNVGPVFELGLQAWSNRRFKLDANFIYVSQGLSVPGPQRNMDQFDLGVDLLWVASKSFEVGPVVAVSNRRFQQQGVNLQRFWVPVVGGRASVPVLHHRRWSWTTDVRVTTDLSLTRLVFDTQELRDLSPVQVQVGQRFNFGHGRHARRWAGEDA